MNKLSPTEIAYAISRANDTALTFADNRIPVKVRDVKMERGPFDRGLPDITFTCDVQLPDLFMTVVDTDIARMYPKTFVNDKLMKLACERIKHDVSTAKELYKMLQPNPYVIPPLVRLSEIKNVIHSAPATIVFWMDGTKTVVKAVNEEYDPEKGIAMAFVKKMFGNKGNYFNNIKKWLPKQTEAKAEDLPKETEAVETEGK